MRESSTEREAARLHALHDQGILDTPPEPDFDDVVYLAAEVCAAPVALITFVDRDRQWCKAGVGTGEREWPRSAGLSPIAIEQDDVIVIPDARADPTLRARAEAAADLPGRFYAGVPLPSAEGHNIGTLCVLDHVPRDLQAWQRGALRLLARLVTRELQIRRARRDLDRRKTETIAALAGGLAHELYHLLVALQEQESLLAERVPQEDPCRAALRRALEGGRQAAGLTRELLSVSRHASPAPQFLDLNDLITRHQPEWQALLGDEVRLRLRLDPDLGRVKADPLQIGQALRCVLEGARGNVPRGGDLLVATERVEGDDVTGGRCVAVLIGERETAPAPAAAAIDSGAPGPDTGPAIGAGLAGIAGHGLDLCVAHGLVAQNGGHLGSHAGSVAGTGIRIVLPAVPADVA